MASGPEIIKIMLNSARHESFPAHKRKIPIVGILTFISRKNSLNCTVNKIRRFYGKIPGIWLPLLLPLFLRAFTCRTFLESKIWSDSTRNYFCRIVGLYDKNNNVLCYRSMPDS